MKKTILFLFAAIIFIACTKNETSPDAPKSGSLWTIEKANEWYAGQKWLSGCNYYPNNAINQLEMWQKETFDPERIDLELGWAESLGFNVMRVYLHSLAWKQDSAGFKDRMNKYLEISDKHKIKTMFVFFDDCWSPEASVGKQPDPKPGVHNSGWLQDPGDPASKDSTAFPALEKYVKDVLKTFAQDKRILLWDLYNEPGNRGKGNSSLPLLKNIFEWAREVNPSQPISSGVWSLDLEGISAFQAMNSDIITYHNYDDMNKHKQMVKYLKLLGRPLICTEYMARTNNSTFEAVMPMLKENNAGAINWGFVAGKTNTIYAWSTPIPDGREPKVWFHDILRADGTPYKESEVKVIKDLNGVN